MEKLYFSGRNRPKKKSKARKIRWRGDLQTGGQLALN